MRIKQSRACEGLVPHFAKMNHKANRHKPGIRVGDFFYDMVCRTRLSQVMSSTLQTPLQALGSLSSPVAFPFNGTDAFGR